MKTVTEGAVLVGLFFLSWFALQQINWVKLFEVKQLSDKTEQKTGDFIWESISKSEVENNELPVIKAIDSIADKLCKANDIDRNLIKVHVLNNSDINAFALPNGHLVVYTGLIIAADNQEEVCGVLAHELAHIQLNHVMKKLVKEVGLSVLLSMTSGKTGNKTAQEIAKKLSSSAFDRSLEKEADLKAVDYMATAKINPGPFADFLYKLAGSNGNADKYLSWISTHPESKERAVYVAAYSKTKAGSYQNVLSQKTWSDLKSLAATATEPAE